MRACRACPKKLRQWWPVVKNKKQRKEKENRDINKNLGKQIRNEGNTKGWVGHLHRELQVWFTAAPT